MKINKQIKQNLKSIRYLFEQSRRCDKFLIPLMLLNMITDSIVPFIAVIFPKYIIDELTIGRNLKSAIIMVIIFFAANLIINSINISIDGVINCKKEKLIQQHYKVFGNKTMSMDLEDIENPNISDQKARAQQVITWNSRNIDGIKNALSGILSFSIQIIGFSYVLARLNIFITFLLLGIIIVNTFLNNVSEKISREINIELTPINRKWNYLSKITDDYSFGKLIRVYSFAPMIIEKCIENRKLFKEKQMKISKNNLYNGIVLASLSIIQEGAVYIFLVLSVISGSITLGDFTMYLAATMAFSTAVNSLIAFTINLNYTSKYVSDYIDFINTPDSLKKEGNTELRSENCTFEFRNVCFKYPLSDTYVLNNINITFGSNDRITLIGDNGAGKTTFIKLLMRFYDPTSGEILLNNKNIKEYEYDEYFKAFSTVFQDYQFFDFTIAENIAFDEAANDDKKQLIFEALNKAGILEKINSLPHGANSYLGKGFEDDGIELSGGEMQKLAIARSIYKNAPIFIMDEPTANLSPISEHNIFKTFNDTTMNKTVLYVSHRLTSTMFSNRIIVFDNGNIVEDGVHQELIKRNGLYKKMFDMQSVYYLDSEVDK